MKTDEAKIIMDQMPSLLKDALVERKAKNKSYSGRAFARDLGLSQTFLSLVLNGKRKLSLEQKVRCAEILGFNVNTEISKKSQSKKMQLIQANLDHEKILKYWYHFAILEMTVTSDVGLNYKEIAKRLGLSEIEIKDAIQRLVNYGYLLVEKKKLVRTKTPIIFNKKHTTQALRQFHQTGLKHSEQELNVNDQERVENRYFQTIYVATSRDKIREAKKMISDFNEKLMNFLTSEKQEEVYQVSQQIFSVEKNK